MIKILFLLIGLQMLANGTDLTEMRKQLDKAANDSKVADQFNDRFKDLNEKTAAPVLLGFKAISEMIQAKHAFSPISKVSHFKKGKRLLELAISKDPNNAELIFFRYTTQVNVPGMLNYSSNLKADRQLLVNFLKADAKAPKDADLHRRIKKYLVSDKPGSATEVEMLKKL
ncbi:hypothetical protein GCM10011387_19500 [Pedobacter quisquiliarum]|jgi:hypothetical protein|uniref:Uncharacterized protein n=1 Tax=Pedobacter quisquiliarum TaxID=1834438 RepID=A0A916UB95_9SPHI|nr:hypothetical protein [Pedobacter quisquiliarum]GGC65996.1 hypothetical protein GCM10011387_19500 [Pedobacter quisquiliarum]